MLARALADGGCVMVLDGPAGWFVSNNLGQTFAPCEDLPPSARRHGRQVFFDNEDSARLAAHKLPGYWSIPQENRQ